MLYSETGSMTGFLLWRLQYCKVLLADPSPPALVSGVTGGTNKSHQLVTSGASGSCFVLILAH